ncbi:MAG TPA: translation initiation factor IF-2 [Cycloclasticus sp.]|jgi:translation initiation factor IF-2|nr:translation initiation factor IF-2 [Cycloclasticus sp.]HIL92633.1 translation initiation factor IF-2 [Cycloclasticus sp.]
MANITVEHLAKVVGTTAEKLVEQLKDAGVKGKKTDSTLSEDDKLKLLAHLRKSHGKAKKDISAPKKMTLKRKSTVTELKQPAKRRGASSGSVSIEVRKKKVIGRSVEETCTGLSTEELEEAKKAAAAHDQLVQEKGAAREKEQGRISKNLEVKEQVEAGKQAKLDAEEAAELAKDAEQSIAAAKEAVVVNQVVDKKSTDTAAKKAQAVARKPDKKKGGGKPGGRILHVDKKPRRKKKSSHRTRDIRLESDDKHAFEVPTKTITYNVEIPESIIVSDLAQRMNVKAGEVIKTLMGLGTMATINQPLDQDTAVIVVEEMGHKVTLRSDEDIQAELLADVIQQDGEEVHRGPVVTIMGHVDHGKTSLLDYIRKSRVAAGESGGITQHIGAYRVKQGDSMMTFIDTPGHAAFTAMRARGAQITDLVILVVAADDGVMPQTKEAVEHARAAGVPMIVAVNKMDKEGAQPDRVRNELSQIEVTPEDWGGDTQFVDISALTGDGVDELLEAIALQAELLELTAPVDVAAIGVVIESRLDKGRGAMATILVQKGTLNVGDYIVAGEAYGRVKAMFDEHGKWVKAATPAVPVEVLGLSSATEAGVEMYAATSERKAREIAEFRQVKSRQARQAKQQAAKLEQAFSQMEGDDSSTLNVLLKTDVHGSLEALKTSLTNLSTDEVKLVVVAGGVGGINESDVNLASASEALIVGFNTRADASARRMIENRGVSVRYYSIIYDVIDDVRDALSGLLAPEIREQIVGIANVRDVFKSPKLGAIAGCMVTEGFVRKDLPIRVLRESVVIYEGQLESLRRFKDDVKDVKNGMECGIGVKDYNDVQAGDQIEVFERIEVKRKL